MYLSDFVENIKKSFQIKNVYKTFDILSIEFVELFEFLYIICEDVNKLMVQFTDEALEVEMNSIRKSLEENMDKVVNILSRLTDRDIAIHIVSANDTLWKISKKYKANICEIYELNNLKNIFSLSENKVILVPFKLYKEQSL